MIHPFSPYAQIIFDRKYLNELFVWPVPIECIKIRHQTHHPPPEWRFVPGINTVNDKKKKKNTADFL